MSDSFAARLEDPSFMTAFNALFDRFTSEQVVTLMKGSVAARLEDPRFRRVFHRLFERFTAEVIARIMNDSVAARLLSPNFLEELMCLDEDAKILPMVRMRVKKHPVVKRQRCAST